MHKDVAPRRARATSPSPISFQKMAAWLLVRVIGVVRLLTDLAETGGWFFDVFANQGERGALALREELCAH